MRKFIYIIQLGFLITLITFFSMENLMALGNSIRSKDPVNVKITRQVFVFKETYGPLAHDFRSDLEEIYNHILNNGGSSTKEALLYLDYGAQNYNSSISLPKTDNNEEIMEYLINVYGSQTINTYRRVLVGYLLPPNFDIPETNTIKVYDFEDMQVLITQSFDSDIRISLADINSPTANHDNDYDNKYNHSHKIYDTISMFNYLNSGNSNLNHIGVLAIYDQKLKTSSFIAIPGDQSEFLESLDLPVTLITNDLPE